MRELASRALTALALVVGATSLSAVSADAEALQPVPPLSARVTDLTGTLTPAEQAALEQKLKAFDARKGAQVAVLIVETTEPEDIAQYGIRVAEAWQLGREKSDDAAILLIAKRDRTLRIEVYDGLEGVLTDATSNRIIDETIVPRFRAGEFAAGISDGVDRILAVVDGELLPPPEPDWEPIGGIERILPFALFAIPMAGSMLRRIFGAVLGPLLAGAGLFAVGWFVTGSLVLASLLALLGAVFGLVAGRKPRGPFRRGGFGGMPGGWGGGFGGGGFGGGGFSGGGGHASGGGASGRW